MKGNAATSRGKLALRFGACIAAGMLLTVLVSWVCALWSPARLELQTRSTASRVPVLDSGTLLMPHRPRPPQTLEIPEPLRRWVPDEWLRPEAANDPLGSFLGADHTRMRGFGLLVHTIDIHVFVNDGRLLNPNVTVHTYRAG